MINIECYTVTVTRAERTEPRITTLAALSIADPADSDDGTDMLSLDPAFVADRAPVADGHTAYVASGVGDFDFDGYCESRGRRCRSTGRGRRRPCYGRCTQLINDSPYTVTLGDRRDRYRHPGNGDCR